MQISSRFTMAIHMFACMDHFKDEKVTSEFMAGSIGTNPVIIRKLLQQLKQAGLVEVSRGIKGVRPAKNLKEITFLDIYRAVECNPEESLFHFHEKPCEACPIGSHVHVVLDQKLDRIQNAMEKEMASITLDQVMDDFKYWIDKDSV